MNHPRCERGAALLTCMLVTTVLLSAAATYVHVSFGGFESSNRELAGVRARLASDEGLHRAIAELKTGVDTGGDGLGNVTYIGLDERQIQTTATGLGGDLWRIHSRGEVPRAALACETLVEISPAPSLFTPLRSAITAEGPVSTTGNISVDGRDWNFDGTAIVGPGVFGISSMDTITNGGSSTVGGNGIAPTQPVPVAVKEPFADWSDGVDQDGDGAVDEEQFNGIDDDGDGRIDEDTNDYPSGPDVLFGLPPGTLKAAAQAQGTYFASESAVNACISANGGNMPGGKIIYCEFDLWLPMELGNQLNAQPSIIIHHNPAGTALMKNLHGSFKGLVLADFVTHINGDFFLLGGVMSFADESVGNTFGNGGASIRFSSDVMNNLPAASALATARVLSWSRAAAN